MNSFIIYTMVLIIFIVFSFFRQQDLFNVLKAYSVLNPEDGYCQAQAPLAAFLLMHMPAEEAFWCFVSICDKYLSGYYSQGMVNNFFYFLYFSVSSFFIITKCSK